MKLIVFSWAFVLSGIFTSPIFSLQKSRAQSDAIPIAHQEPCFKKCLYAHIRAGDYEAIQKLLADNLRRIDIANLLIAAGAHLNIQNIYGDTALMWAACGNNTEIVKLLVEAGADTTIVNEKRKNKMALDYATDKDAFNKAVAEGLAYHERQAQARKIIESRQELDPNMSAIFAGYAYGPSIEDMPESQAPEAEKKTAEAKE